MANKRSTSNDHIIYGGSGLSNNSVYYVAKLYVRITTAVVAEKENSSGRWVGDRVVKVGGRTRVAISARCARYDFDYRCSPQDIGMLC